MRPGRSSGTSSETGEATATVNGDAVTMTNDELNVDSATAKVPLNVVNSKGFDLPQTAGAGLRKSNPAACVQMQGETL